MDQKPCVTCGITRPEAPYRPWRKGLCGRCYHKQINYSPEQKAKRKQQWKKYRDSHKTERTKLKKAYNSSARGKLVIAKSENKLKRKEDKRRYQKDYRKDYDKRPEVVASRNNQRKIRIKTDIQYRIASCLRSRLSSAIKDNQKTGSAVRDLGCSINFFKNYLESKFTEGMTWENHGMYGWHIDHITPMSAFDLTDREQLLKACHYTNMQPLWAIDNLQKGAKVLELNFNSESQAPLRKAS